MDYLSKVILGLIIFGFIFMVLREFFCWYAKVNERLDEQKLTNVLLKEIITELKKKNT